jgi:hypothetical protein
MVRLPHVQSTPLLDRADLAPAGKEREQRQMSKIEIPHSYSFLALKSKVSWLEDGQRANGSDDAAS